MGDTASTIEQQARRCTHCGEIIHADIGAARCPQNGNVLTRYEPVEVPE